MEEAKSGFNTFVVQADSFKQAAEKLDRKLNSIEPDFNISFVGAPQYFSDASLRYVAVSTVLKKRR